MFGTTEPEVDEYLAAPSHEVVTGTRRKPARVYCIGYVTASVFTREVDTAWCLNESNRNTTQPKTSPRSWAKPNSLFVNGAGKDASTLRNDLMDARPIQRMNGV